MVGAKTARTRARRLSVVLFASVVAGGLLHATAGHAAGTTPRTSWDRPPTEAEFTLLTLANMARSDPSKAVPPGPEPAAAPLVWNDDLATAARYHSWDEIAHGCDQHDSCNGQLWWKRVQSYYPGWYALGENIAGAGLAEAAHGGWMASPGHRASILNPTYREFGGGVFPEEYDSQATEDFGARATAVAIPAIPAATVFLPQRDNGGTTWPWQLLLNYYDAQGRMPVAIKAFVDGASYSLSHVVGTTTNGTWGTSVSTPGWPASGAYPTLFCKHVSYEVTRSDGETFRYPTTGFIGLGYAPGCDTRTTSSTPPTSTTVPGSNNPPKVVIVSPSMNARVAKTVVITAHATDDGAVVKIEIYVDDKRLMTRRAPAISRGWNAGQTAVRPGTHTIMVKAYDDSGNVGTASITVTK
jgi:Bacterial Ig domain/Cysteine-rich secretory protein family